MSTNIDVEQFIEEHNRQYVNYFEAVILPDGHIEYSIPSHTYKLEMLWGVPLEEIYDGGDSYEALMKQIPMWASPISWLCNNLNIVVCWYNQSMFPFNYTKEQVKTFNRLVECKCVHNMSDIDMSIEDLITNDNITPEQAEKLHFDKIKRLNSLKESLEVI